MIGLPDEFIVEIDLPIASLDGPFLHFGDAVTGKFGTGKFAADQTFVDVSAYVRSGSISRGTSRFDGVYARAEAGRAQVVLNNADARFDPTNLSGPYVAAGVSQIYPMRAWRISADGHALWRGFADSWDLTYPATLHDAVCNLSGTDGTKVLSNFNGPEQSSQGGGETTGARIGRILDNAGWPAADRVIATGLTTVQATTLAQPAWTEILLTADTEIGEIYFDGSGRITFRDRHALLEETRSVNSQATFGDAGAELRFVEIDLAHDDTQIANVIRIARSGGTEKVAEDVISQIKYLKRSFERSDLVHQTDAESQDYANFVLAILATADLRFDTLTLIPGSDPTNLWPQALGRELGDRVTVKLRPPGREVDPITRDVYIRGIDHEFGPALWTTRLTLQDASRFDFLILDHATLGILDANRLAF